MSALAAFCTLQPERRLATAFTAVSALVLVIDIGVPLSLGALNNIEANTIQLGEYLTVPGPLSTLLLFSLTIAPFLAAFAWSARVAHPGACTADDASPGLTVRSHRERRRGRVLLARTSLTVLAAASKTANPALTQAITDRIGDPGPSGEAARSELLDQLMQGHAARWSPSFWEASAQPFNDKRMVNLLGLPERFVRCANWRLNSLSLV